MTVYVLLKCLTISGLVTHGCKARFSVSTKVRFLVVDLVLRLFNHVSERHFDEEILGSEMNLRVIFAAISLTLHLSLGNLSSSENNLTLGMLIFVQSSCS